MKYAIIDLQFGSTGKGQLSGELAMRLQPDVVACAFTPNAGHTFVDKAGKKFIHRAIPNGVISPKLKHVLIGPGAVIDIGQMLLELAMYEISSVIIHPNAVILEENHRVQEVVLARIGSTMKGTAAALISKMNRNPNMATLAHHLTWFAPFIVDADAYMEAWENAKVLQIEGTQGYSLSMHHGFWPYVTAKDTTVMQLLADTAIPNVDIIWGTLRTFPIRVANRPEGTSGPCYPDQKEIEWSDLGLEAELTTVTKLPRRIFTFSKMQVEKAIRQNRVTHLYLNFLNYLTPHTGEREDFISMIENLCQHYCQVAALGYGPNDVKFI